MLVSEVMNCWRHIIFYIILGGRGVAGSPPERVTGQMVPLNVIPQPSSIHLKKFKIYLINIEHEKITTLN
jgi:hypothetical protein